MKEVKEVHQELKQCIESAGHELHADGFAPKRYDRPTMAENTLSDAMIKPPLARGTQKQQ